MNLVSMDTRLGAHHFYLQSTYASFLHGEPVATRKSNVLPHQMGDPEALQDTQEPARPVDMLCKSQDVAAINTGSTTSGNTAWAQGHGPGGHCVFLGDIPQRAIVTPDLEQLLQCATVGVLLAPCSNRGYISRSFSLLVSQSAPYAA